MLVGTHPRTAHEADDLLDLHGPLSCCFDCRQVVHGFRSILTSRQGSQKSQCLYGNLMEKHFFPKVNFTQFLNQNVKLKY